MSTLEEQLTEYFTALADHATVPAMSSPRRRRTRPRLLLIAAALTTCAVGIVAVVLLRGDASSPPRIATPAPATTSTPQTDALSDAPSAPWPELPSFTTSVCLVDTGPDVWITAFESQQSRCRLVSPDQRLQIVNKGFSPMALEWNGTTHQVQSDGSYTTGRVGDVLDSGNHQVSVSPYPPIQLTVVAPDTGRTSTLTFDGHSIGPVHIGQRLDDLITTSGWPFVWAEDPTATPICRTAFVQDEPASPTLTVGQTKAGDTIVTAIAIANPNQHGPGGIHTGMSRADLQAVTGRAWEPSNLLFRDDLGDQFLAWKDAANGTEIIAALRADVTQLFVLRSIANPLRDLGTPTRECALS